MPCKTLCLILLLAPVFTYAGLSCEMSKVLQAASSSGKLGDKFWQDYARISGDGIGDRELSSLMQKHGVGIPRSPVVGGRRATDVAPQRVRPRVEKTVYRDVDRLPPALKQKYAQVVEYLTTDPTGALFYKQPGKWHFEKLPGYGPYAHSVRLDGGYRVLIDIKDKVASIRKVDKTIGH